jgi:hypothetical protein
MASAELTASLHSLRRDLDERKRTAGVGPDSVQLWVFV